MNKHQNAVAISAYLESKDINLSPDEVEGLLKGTKAVLDTKQSITYDVEGGDISQDGVFVSTNFKANWNEHRKRWECDVWTQLNAWGLSYKREVCSQKDRDYMTRRIYIMTINGYPMIMLILK